MNDFAIEIYTTPTCPDCKAAKEFLSQHNLNYAEHDIVENEENIKELNKLTGKKILFRQLRLMMSFLLDFRKK